MSAGWALLFVAGILNLLRYNEHHFVNASWFAACMSVASGKSTASMGASSACRRILKYEFIITSPVAALACRRGICSSSTSESISVCEFAA
ncbi:hypothetical protein PF005_g32391 [Phytophthora fragariae]|uniref:Secreted protein n=1 Tax=Phytophthora fragariae TaxID=53985 RepID=A0A6A3VD60_9STRA|nr:hypothetical protein PF006_g31722 [Phytophthora fragariae]KAE9158581.1 hypothetical protein PF005_g32391 [Phytophthora fragariae]KAE9259035.1 hypothetical protein PF001_g33159 [Phytophthora fragariae]